MNNVDLVQATENTLGWVPVQPGDVPLFRLRIVEAAKLKRKRATRPTYYTEANFMLALKYCRQEHVCVSPVGVLSYVQAALERANAPQTFEDIEDGISAALTYEKEVQPPGYRQWIVRLTRASGTARRQVYEEWQRERGR